MNTSDRTCRDSSTGGDLTISSGETRRYKLPEPLTLQRESELNRILPLSLT